MINLPCLSPLMCQNTPGSESLTARHHTADVPRKAVTWHQVDSVASNQTPDQQHSVPADRTAHHVPLFSLLQVNRRLLALVATKAFETLQRCAVVVLWFADACSPLCWSVQLSCRLSCVQTLQEVSSVAGLYFLAVWSHDFRYDPGQRLWKWTMVKSRFLYSLLFIGLV